MPGAQDALLKMTMSRKVDRYAVKEDAWRLATYQWPWPGTG